MKRYEGTIQQYISEHHSRDWAVLIIDPALNMIYMSPTLSFRSWCGGPHALSGIHKEALLFVVNPDIEDWMPRMIQAVTTSKYSAWMPFNV